MANQLGHQEAADRLQEILDQELACDAKLNGLAAMLLPLANKGADDAEEDEVPKPAAKKSSSLSSAVRGSSAASKRKSSE